MGLTLGLWLLIGLVQAAHHHFHARQVPISSNEVNIFHLIDNALWGEVDGSFLQGSFPCGEIKCQVHSSDSPTNLLDTLVSKYDTIYQKEHSQSLSVGLYSIHSWKPISKFPHKPSCSLPTGLNIAESEESYSRFKHLFDSSFPFFDGNSTTHPMSTIQRYYVSALNVSEFLVMKPVSELIKGAAFVASTCHRGKSTTRREWVVEQISRRLRVDSLGKCMSTKTGPEGIILSTGKNALESLRLKQLAISNYMFYLAFENTYEPGYITEKVFDALVAGVVPVFLGSAVDCKRLMPAANAAIFIDDFGGDIQAVVEYLVYLTSNFTAYDEHRQWRPSFLSKSYIEKLPFLAKSWPCRICEWARLQYTYGKYRVNQINCT